MAGSGWTLPKPWENGYVPVTEAKIGTQGTDGNTRVRRWKKAEVEPEPDPVP